MSLEIKKSDSLAIFKAKFKYWTKDCIVFYFVQNNCKVYSMDTLIDFN